MAGSLNFEAKDEKELVELHKTCRGISSDFLARDFRKCKYYLGLYKMKLDPAMVINDPYRIYPKIGLVFSTIESYKARTIKALFSQTPFFPLVATQRNLRANAEAVTTLLDDQARRHVHFLDHQNVVTLGHICGWSFYEHVWRVNPGYRRQRRGEEKVFVNEEGLELRTIPPWAVLFDPLTKKIRDMRWLIHDYPISRHWLERMLDAGVYEGVKKEDIKQYDKASQTSKEYYDRLHYSSNNDHRDDDLLMFTRMYLPGTLREVWLINGEHVIRNVQAETLDDFEIPIKAMINTDNPLPDSLVGVSDLQVVGQLEALQEYNLGYRLNKQVQDLDQVWLYDPAYFSTVKHLRAGGNSRIAIDSAKFRDIADGNWDKVMHQLKSNPSSEDSWRLAGELRQHYNEAIGQDPTARGAAAGEDRTKFEIMQRLDRGDERFALKMRMVEAVCLEGLAAGCVRMIANNMRESQAQAILGERYKNYVYHTPEEFPKGAEFRLKGSMLIGGSTENQNERLALMQTVGPIMGQRTLAEAVIDNTDPDVLSAEQKEKILQEAEAQAQAASGGAGLPEEIMGANRTPTSPEMMPDQGGMMREGPRGRVAA